MHAVRLKLDDENSRVGVIPKDDHTLICSFLNPEDGLKAILLHQRSLDRFKGDDEAIAQCAKLLGAATTLAQKNGLTLGINWTPLERE
jgi:hypothetical protein